MSSKSRGNFRIGLCLRYDCIHAGTHMCNKCFKFKKYTKDPNYDPAVKYSFTDAYKQPLSLGDK